MKSYLSLSVMLFFTTQCPPFNFSYCNCANLGFKKRLLIIYSHEDTKDSTGSDDVQLTGMWIYW